MEHEFIKITNQAYKVLDFFPEADPLKSKTKEKVLAILEGLTLLYGNHGTGALPDAKVVRQLLDDMNILENYLEVARFQGWISDMNVLIIKKAYQNIANNVSSYKRSSDPPTSSTELAGAKESTVPTTSQKLGTRVIENKQEKYSPRQIKILEILAEHQKAQVSDLIKRLPKVTKRTVRRDLDDLLKKGKILRSGEWNQVFYRVNA